MKHTLRILGVSAFAFLAVPHSSSGGEAPANPLLLPWPGPYGGRPPFDQIRLEHFRPAFEAAIQEKLAQIDAIAARTDTPTFSNTFVALEDAGRTLGNVRTVFDIWTGTLSTPEVQALEEEFAPKLAELGDKIIQNPRLFQRLESAYQSSEQKKLTPEQRRLCWYTYTSFVRQGAKLDAASKTRVGGINQRLASLFTKFSNNVLGDENEYVLYLSAGELAGLPAALCTSAAGAAEARGHKGSFAILNTRSSMEPFLTYSERRDLREKVWRTYYNRGDNGDARDNNTIITEILKLRAERATLLGYKTHAHWCLENSMAGTPEKAMALMEDVWKPAVARVHEEVADMQVLADKEKVGITIEGWDYRFYAEKVRKARYDLDQNEVKPYLQLDTLRQAMFWVAGELFNYEFRPVSGAAVYHPDVSLYEVRDRTTGRHIGDWYFDPYARTGKRSGAWMNAYRSQERFREEIPTIVSNNANFMKAAEGEPILISWDETAPSARLMLK